METKFPVYYRRIINYVYEYEEKDQLDEQEAVWAVKMFAAALDNLQTQALPIEIEEFGEQIEPEEIDYLMRLAKDLK